MKAILLLILASTPLNPNLNRDRLKDSESQSLTEKIRLASKAYLQLNTTEAERLLKESTTLLLSNQPYPSIKSDLAQLASLNLVLREEAPQTELYLDPFPVRSEPEFQRNISDRMRERWATENRASVEISELKEFSSIRVMGESLRLPTTLPEGTYLAHSTKDSKNWGGWLHISAKDGVRFEKAFEIQASAVEPAPASQRLQRNSAKVNDWLELQRGSDQKARSLDFTELDIKSSRESDALTPIYQKTWFWIAVGLISGIGGYATYQATRSPTVVQLP